MDQSIGKNTANGNLGLIEPTRIIEKDFEELTIDGVKMVFQNTPGTEAPAEMNTYFPQFKAFWAAENITGTVHNIYTLRGALVRDALEWSKQINTALYRFGQEAEAMFSAHSWPRWGNARIQEVMRTQRDIYANLNNEVLHLANQGVTINEIHNVYKPPKSLQKQWAAHSYHGSEEHNSRAVINRYLGYWDANPATLIPLSPRDSAPLYVEMMGGAEKIMAKGKELYDQGKYRHAIEILNKLVYAEPKNQAAKDLLADVFEQIGYQKESPSVRNSFLACGVRTPLGHSRRNPAQEQRAGHGSCDVNRPVARLPRHPSGQQEGRRYEVRHQPCDARQWRKVRGGDEQLDAHQHQGRAGEEPRSDHNGQPLRSRDGDDGQGHVRRSALPPARQRLMVIASPSIN